MSSHLQLIRRPGANVDRLPGPCVATIGTFDGVHVGHQQILGRVIDEAAQRKVASVVLSFEPTPREYFSKGVPPARLTRFREKFEILETIGVNCLFCPPFDAVMERMSPAEFIDNLLVRVLDIKHLVVGDDFVFARNRSGDIEDLRAAGEASGFSVERVGSIVEKGGRVSSTEIRRALSAGDMLRAAQLLGRNYSMTGRVVDGQKLGKQLGFPTANVSLNRRASPVAGIFAVRVAGADLSDEPLGSPARRLLDGVASVGTRPTVDGVEPILEVHIFDFDRDIYGEYIKVEFVAKLRDEVKFPDLESLTQQMNLDAAAARKILNAA
jgi:riboflavin kinase/FMN adenylyltransferase